MPFIPHPSAFILAFSALRALAYVGTRDDLPLIETYANSSTDTDLCEAALAAAKSIQSQR